MYPHPSPAELTLRAFLWLALTLAGTAPLPAAELLPFPEQQPSDAYQQQPPPPARHNEEVRQKIGRLPCPELQTLSGQIREQADRAASEADRDYYLRILQELNKESAARCQP